MKGSKFFDFLSAASSHYPTSSLSTDKKSQQTTLSVKLELKTEEFTIPVSTEEEFDEMRSILSETIVDALERDRNGGATPKVWVEAIDKDVGGVVKDGSNGKGEAWEV